MKFETRNKKTVLADLTERLRSLPICHPDRAILTRMIEDLGYEDSAAKRAERYRSEGDRLHKMAEAEPNPRLRQNLLELVQQYAGLAASRASGASKPVVKAAQPPRRARETRVVLPSGGHIFIAFALQGFEDFTRIILGVITLAI